MSASPYEHRTVLLDEVVALMKPGPNKQLVDATLGGGGHAEVLLQAGARVLGIDRDPRALDAARARLARFPQFRAAEGNFGELGRVLEREQASPVDGVLLDLGVSSPQLDEPERGFSFQRDGPLDMRMGNTGPTAAEIVAETAEDDLAKSIRELGEEPFARPIARELKRAGPKSTLEAVAAVQRAVPRRAWPKRIHVATKTFQALRMVVNQELEALEGALRALPKVLGLGGIAAIISFQSLEDRQVKQTFRDYVGTCRCPPNFPVCVCGSQGDFRALTKKAVVASEAEIAANPRARSARLRAVEKIR